MLGGGKAVGMRVPQPAPTAMEALDSVLTKAILSPELKVSPLPMAVGVQCGGARN